MGRKTKTILAHLQGLESQKISGGGRSVFLDFSFYRTYQDLGGNNAIELTVLIDSPYLSKNSVKFGDIRLTSNEASSEIMIASELRRFTFELPVTGRRRI